MGVSFTVAQAYYSFVYGRVQWLRANTIFQCFPLDGTWYMVCRNYESDPLLGGTTKCISITETGPLENDVVPVQYGIGNEAL